MLVDFAPQDIRSVVEYRPDRLHPFVDLDFVVVPVNHVEHDLEALDDLIAQIPHAEVEATHAAHRVDVDENLLFFMTLLIFVVALFLVTLLFVAVKLARERDSETPVLDREAAAREELVAAISKTGPSGGESGLRVLDHPVRRLVVVGAPGSAARPHQQVPL